MEDLINEALSSVGIDAYYLYRPNLLGENAVYTYTMKPIAYADNEIKAFEYSILINIFVTLDKDISLIRDNVINAMQNRGFKLQQVPIPNKEKDFINIALRFKGAKFLR